MAERWKYATNVFAMFNENDNLVGFATAEQDGTYSDITAELAILLSKALAKRVTDLEDTENAYEAAQSAAEDRRWC